METSNVYVVVRRAVGAVRDRVAISEIDLAGQKVSGSPPQSRSGMTLLQGAQPRTSCAANDD